jgi:hypothetical protein
MRQDDISCHFLARLNCIDVLGSDDWGMVSLSEAEHHESGRSEKAVASPVSLFLLHQ